MESTVTSKRNINAINYIIIKLRSASCVHARDNTEGPTKENFKSSYELRNETDGGSIREREVIRECPRPT